MYEQDKSQLLCIKPVFCPHPTTHACKVTACKQVVDTPFLQLLIKSNYS